MRRHRGSSSVRRSRWVGALALAIFVAGCDPIRVISVSRQLERPPDDACVLRVLQSSEDVRTAGRSSDGTLFAELVIPASIDPPWHPDPKSPTRFTVLESPTEEEKTDFTFRVLWVAGAESSAEYQRYVENVLTKLQATTVEACSRQADG